MKDASDLPTADRSLLLSAVRRWLVVRLIRWADRGWTASYAAYVRCDKDGLPWAWSRFWSGLANRIDRTAMRLCRHLDPDNRWMGAEAAEYGWWG